MHLQQLSVQTQFWYPTLAGQEGYIQRCEVESGVEDVNTFMTTWIAEKYGEKTQYQDGWKTQLWPLPAQKTLFSQNATLLFFLFLCKERGSQISADFFLQLQCAPVQKGHNERTRLYEQLQ